MNFLDIVSRGMPLTNKTFRFMQDSYKDLLGALAVSIGDFTILSGMERDGGDPEQITDGWLVYNGEILPFVGGAFAGTVKIIELVEQVEYNTDVDDDTVLDTLDLYVTRYATTDTEIEPAATFDYFKLVRMETINKHFAILAEGVTYLGVIPPVSDDQNDLEIEVLFTSPLSNSNYTVLGLFRLNDDTQIADKELSHVIKNKTVNGFTVVVKSTTTVWTGVYYDWSVGQSARKVVSVEETP